MDNSRRALIGTAVSVLLLFSPAAADATTVKFQASDGPTVLHRLGYFRLRHTSNLEVNWTKSSDECGMEIDIFKTHDPYAYYRASIYAAAHSSGPVELVAELRGRYKVKVGSNCAAWSLVITKTN